MHNIGTNFVRCHRRVSHEYSALKVKPWIKLYEEYSLNTLLFADDEITIHI